ncbi:probable G-protein coupled receptor 139 [Dreissena polymorpha]|uniref:probable G-protein coupled receptor 139 n=1 Tax=Dreissena polymorpha TaxID=45954 RepID=UPI002264DD7F|nr:probable G-protein coupled receptor 139 [Dreissena polymorpha]
MFLSTFQVTQMTVDNTALISMDPIFETDMGNASRFHFKQIPEAQNSNSYDQYETFYLRARFITGLVFYPIVCVFGITGNIMSIIVMSQRQMRSSTNTYLFALAVSDLIKLLCDFLYFTVILLFQIDTPTGNKAYGFLYPYAHYVFNASLCISAWLIVSVAVERYVYVCHPTKVKFFCNIHKARIISTSVFIIMAILAIPYAMRYRTIHRLNNKTGSYQYDVIVTELWKNQMFTEIYTWFQNLMRSIIPLVILIVLNTCIIYGLRRCRIFRAKAPKKHKITSMLVVVIIVFLLCITPDTIMSTFFGLGYSEENFLARGIREITDLLLLINSAVNFIIYCIFNTIFWCQFQRLFCYTCCRRHRGVSDARNLSLLDIGSARSILRRRSDF